MENFNDSLFATASHSNESDNTIYLWAKNLDIVLNKLAESYPNTVGEVVLYLNGEGLDSIYRRSYIKDIVETFSSNLNLDIKLWFTPIAGKTDAVVKLYEKSQKIMKPILMTDIDVLRLSDSVLELWKSMLNNPEKKVIGTRFYALPMEYSLLKMNQREKFWYQVLEGDKNPDLHPIINTRKIELEVVS